MKIIITGGSGLIGSALIDDLLQSGKRRGEDAHEIFVTSRSPEKQTDLPPSVKAIKWDGKTAAGWGQYVEGADAIVNLAGESIAPLPWIGDRKEKIRASRVNAGKAIVDAVTKAKVKPRVLVQSSAVGYYGIHGDETLTESSPAGNDFMASVCVDWEKSTDAVEAMGVRRAIYRAPIVLSRKGGVLPPMSLPFKFFAGGKLGSGKQWMPWVHIADMIAALRFVMVNEAAKGVFNFTAPNPVRNADFSSALGKALGRPSAIPVPRIALKLLFGEMADLLLLNGQRVVPEHLKQMGFQFQYPTIEAALKNVYA